MSVHLGVNTCDKWRSISKQFAPMKNAETVGVFEDIAELLTVSKLAYLSKVKKHNERHG